ncbi:MAG: nucleotidyltransferase [Blastocatellia bacterium]
MKKLEPQITLLVSFQVDFIIIGGVAVVMHGADYFTHDLDVCYSRTPENLEKLATALKSVNARLRGVPAGLPFILDAQTLKQGLNFTFETDIGPLDLLGEVAGVGTYLDAIKQAMAGQLFGYDLRLLSLSHLIAAKRAAGRNKDLLVLPELEAILEAKKSEN